MAVDPARAKSLFLAAADFADPAERAAYLDRACGEEAELRARVEALLRANDASALPERLLTPNPPQLRPDPSQRPGLEPSQGA